MNQISPFPTRYEALMMVRQSFATEQAMAEAFGVSQPTVWRWLNQSKQMPAERGEVLIAEKLTGVSRHHLRPDIYPIDLPPAGRFYGVDHPAAGRDFTSRAILKDGRLTEVRTA